MGMFKVGIVNADVFKNLPKQMRRAVINTTNVIGRLSNRTVSQDMKKAYNIPARTTKINHNIFLTTAKADKLQFRIRIKSRPRGVFKFPHRQTSAGLEVEIKRGKRQLIRGAFVAPLRKNNIVGINKGTFKRRTEANNVFAFVRSRSRGRVTRVNQFGTSYSAEKRKVIFGFDVRDVYASKFGKDKIQKVIKEKYQEVLDEKFLTQVTKGK